MPTNDHTPLELALMGHNGRVEVTVGGDLVTESAGDLRRVLEDIIARVPNEVVVDLGGVTFVDTAGIGVLVGLRKQFKSRNVPFRVTNPRQSVRDVFKRMSLESVFGLA